MSSQVESPGDSEIAAIKKKREQGPAGISRSLLWRIARLIRITVLPRKREPRTRGDAPEQRRSEEHTSELQSLMRISYDVLCLQKKNNHKSHHHTENKTQITYKKKR